VHEFLNIRIGIILPSLSKVRKWLDEEFLAIVKRVSVATSEIINKINLGIIVCTEFKNDKGVLKRNFCITNL